AILRHDIDVFGVPRAVGAPIDWLRDPLTGRRCDGDGLFPDGVDPKGCWELARGGHLVELAAAARVAPELADRARAEIADAIGSFLDGNPVGRGIHYASPLEVAMRALHWLAAVELAGGAGAFPRAFVERLAGALLADGAFLATHLEDRGIVPANHLLGDYVGLWALGLALDGAPHARAWQALAARGLAVEAARQVGSDGAHFEASTAYHRFALELMLAAHLWARAADRPSPVAETLHRMLVYLRNYVGPDGCEPAFGDGDDARLFPIVPRPARQHAYLLPVGAALFGDPELRAPGVPFSEEALWLDGPGARRVWAWLPATPAPPSASFPTGGVHILRSAAWQVELRSGSYGQKGVGGHAHNDQLSLVAWLDGAPLLVDAGTGRYAADMILRDHFRGTAAHSTVVVDGHEQSPFLRGRPFALIDPHGPHGPYGRARLPRVRLEDRGSVATVAGEHAGYARLRCRVRHRRHVTLRRDLEVVIVEDLLSGRGEAGVDVRWHLAQPVRRGEPASARARLAALESVLGPLALDTAVTIGDEGRCVLVRSAPDDAEVFVESALFSPGYGRIETLPLVSHRARLTFPKISRTFLIRMGA
ncbi:MAG TPA: alginate lyase family protein, partial [Polyangia bacterium]